MASRVTSPAPAMCAPPIVPLFRAWMSAFSLTIDPRAVFTRIGGLYARELGLVDRVPGVGGQRAVQ